MIDDPICGVVRGRCARVNRQTVGSGDRPEVVVLVEHLHEYLGISGLSVLLSTFGKNTLEQHLTGREQLDERDGASGVLIGRDDVGDVLFIPGCENVCVDQVDLFRGSRRDKVASKPPDDTPRMCRSRTAAPPSRRRS